MNGIVTRLAAELRIREALNNDGVVVYYQPILSLRDGTVRSVEALAASRTAHGTIVTPDQFMDAAEHSGLVRDIDRLVRRRVADDWSVIAAATSPDLRVNINVSQSELNPALADELRTLDPPCRVIVEVTEASLLSNPGWPATRWNDPSPWRAGGHRRLRHRLLVVVADRRPALRHAQDRPQLRLRHVRDEHQRPSWCAIVQLAEDLGLQTVAEVLRPGNR